LPDAIFFTTDLDAAFLHPEEYKSTHNLIIAASFDLELNHDLLPDVDVVPFRDSYQTSLFFSTLFVCTFVISAIVVLLTIFYI
jgi:hypothetical protein